MECNLCESDGLRMDTAAVDEKREKGWSTWQRLPKGAVWPGPPLLSFGVIVVIGRWQWQWAAKGGAETARQG